MRIASRTLVAGDLEEEAFPDYPGMRLYRQRSASGFPLSVVSTDGAVALWNPEGYDSAPFDDDLSRASLRARWFTPRLPAGARADHFRYATVAGRSLADGAYFAVEQLNRVFYLESGERTDNSVDPLRRAHQVAELHYCTFRDYLADDEQIPYLIACLVADRFTHHFTRYNRVLSPLPA